MGRIKINTKEVMASNHFPIDANKKLIAARNEIANIHLTLDPKIKSRNNIDTRLHSLRRNIEVISDDVNSIRFFVENASNRYTSADKKVAENGKMLNAKLQKMVMSGASSFLQEVGSGSASEFSKITKKNVIERGKNFGKYYASKLQHRNAKGQFEVDNMRSRKWLCGKLKGLTPIVSKRIMAGVKLGGRSLTGLNAVLSFKEHYDDYHNVERAASYSAFVTGAGVAASAVVGLVVTGSSVTTALAGTVIAGTALATVAAFALPVVAGAIAAVAVGYAVKAAYDNCKPFKGFVDGIGDRVGGYISNLGDALSSKTSTQKGFVYAK
jgi:prophage DNA circulation protein